MKKQLLETILDCNWDRFVEQVASIPLDELSEMRAEIPSLIETHCSEHSGGESYRRVKSIEKQLRLISLLGAKVDEIPAEVEWLKTGTKHERFGASLAQLIPLVEWPHAAELAKRCLPDDWPFQWVVPFCLAKAGLIQPAPWRGWLMWMPQGLNNLAYERDISGVQLLKDEPMLLELVDQFFADPLSGSLCSIYCGSHRNIVGIGDKPPKLKELENEKDWQHFSLYCIGVSLVGLAKEGIRSEEDVCETFFHSLSFVKNTQSARWLVGLIDLVCDDEQLAAREGQAESGNTARQLAGHPVEALSKWAVKRLAALAKKGLIPLESFAETCAPVINGLPKTLAKSTLKAMSARLKKDKSAADSVRAVATAAMQFDDKAVTDIAEALLQQCEPS